MKINWQVWSEKFDAYSLRERLLLLLCLLALLVGVWQLAFALPQEKHREQMQGELAQVKTDIQAQEAQRQAFTSASQGTEDSELARLENRLEELNRQLASLSQGLVEARQLPEILQQVLISTTDVRLHRLRTLPVRELQLQRLETEAEATETERATGIFQHRVELEVSASYFQLLALLQRLEGLRWRFYWDSLDYQRDDYPRGDIRLRVHTLTAEEGLLGV